MNNPNVKKFLLIVLSAIIILIISFLILELTSSDNNDNNKDNVVKVANEDIIGNVIKTGYIQAESTSIIRNVSDLSNYISRYNITINNIYNNEYFKKKSLAIIYVDLTSGMYSLKYEGVKTLGDSLVVNYSIMKPSGAVTDDMSGAIIIVEVDKYIETIEAKEI